MNGSNHVPYKRNLEDLLNLRRSMWANYIREAQIRNFSWRQARKPTFHQARAFFNTVVWVLIYLKHRFGRRHPFLDYTGDAGRGIYALTASFPLNGERPSTGEIRISLAGDWGAATPEAGAVASRIREFNPHYTIHLGDIYFVGHANEVRENCLGDPHGKQIHAVAWPIGSRGSFALNGNHEMYANGHGYFKVFLPNLGMRPGPKLRPSGQKASFFALENDAWIIIGVDTGYNSVGMPVLERVAYVKKIPYVGGDCCLPSALVRWLREAIKPELAGRGVILLSHHPYCASFERPFAKAGVQLREFIDKPVLWFWGNQHRLAIYGPYHKKNGITAYGRCVGHGGMPVTIHQKPRHCPGEDPLVVYDDREYRAVGSTPVGYNGYANLIFQGSRLRIEYRDLRHHDNLLLTEDWETRDGQIVGRDIRIRTFSPDFKQYNPDLRAAIGSPVQHRVSRVGAY